MNKMFMKKILNKESKSMDELIIQKNKEIRRKGKIVLIVGIILIVFSPIIFTRDFGLLNFNNTGEIGDTIGGLTSPIIGIIGAYLVFLSFKEQWLANQIQIKTINENKENEIQLQRVELIWKLYNEVKIDFLNQNISQYFVKMVQNKTLSKSECEQSYFFLSPIMNNLKLLLTVLKGMDKGYIDKNYAAIFISKFDLLVSSIEPFKIVAGSSEIVENRFLNQLNDIKKLQTELRELKWE